MGQAKRLASKANDGRKNFIINGVAPFVNQEGDKTGVVADFIGDIWNVARTGAAAFNINVATSGGEDWLEVDISTADASMEATDLVNYQYRIEGYDAAPLHLGTANAKTVTLSFKHKHTKTGTYCVGLQNSANDRSYIFEYTQSVSDTEETHTETIALDTTGTWLTDNGVGLRISWVIGAGSDRHGTADTWQAGDLRATTNQVNAADTIGNKIRIRDIQLEIGEVATEPEYIPYADKLAQVQRYFVTNLSVQYALSASAITTHFMMTTLPVEMRVTPSVNSFTITANNNVGSETLVGQNQKIIRQSFIPTGTGAVNSRFDDIILDARL